MKNYYRVILGAKSKFAKECYDNGFIGADYGINQDLTNELTDNWRDFNEPRSRAFYYQAGRQDRAARHCSRGRSRTG